MKNVTGATLDKFQDLVEPFNTVPDYATYFFLGTLIVVVVFLYGLYRYKTLAQWRRLKLIERDCLQGGSPRIALQRINSILKQVSTIPDSINQDIKMLCYRHQQPTLNEISLLLVKLKPLLTKPRQPEVSSNIARVIND